MREILTCLNCSTELEVNARFIPNEMEMVSCPICQSDDISVEPFEELEDD